MLAEQNVLKSQHLRHFRPTGLGKGIFTAVVKEIKVGENTVIRRG